jgi:hypothetical protein
MNKAIKVLRATFRLAKAWLGLPYVPIGILMLLAFSWFNNPPDLMVTGMLMFAFPVSWLCRLQCEKEQSFYKKLYFNGKRYLQASQGKTATAKNCTVCNRTVSSENSFCPYCGAVLKAQKVAPSNSV